MVSIDGQISMLEGKQPLKITKPIRLIELFAGIGAQAKALENIGVEFEHYHICEFDKYAVASYNAVHGTEFTTSDITKIHASDLGIIETDKYGYIMTYSFPCTDLSKAGKQQGMSKGSGTRSGLLWEVERILKEAEEIPQILLMENVPDVLSEKNRADFFAWYRFLEDLGYTNKYAILNAKDFGVPQNRNRCFMLSWLGDFYYDFPKSKPLTVRLKDFLDTSVDEKYYLSDKLISSFVHNEEKQRDKGNSFKFSIVNKNGEAKAITTKEGWRMTDNFIKCECVGKISAAFEMNSRVYSNEGLSPTILTMQGGGLKPKILDEQNGYIRKDGIVGTLTTDGSSPKHNNRIIEPIVWDGFNQSIRKDSSCVGTLTRNCGADLKRNGQGIIEGFRVRKLTPKECWRLMGFDDESFSRAEKKVSNSQLYKQAGNSIVVPVLEAIFRQML